MPQLEWNVLKITEETDKLYDRIVAKGGRYKLTLTREKMIEARGWQPSLYLTKDNFERALTELGCYYVPKVMQPGRLSERAIGNRSGEGKIVGCFRKSI